VDYRSSSDVREAALEVTKRFRGSVTRTVGARIGVAAASVSSGPDSVGEFQAVAKRGRASSISPDLVPCPGPSPSDTRQPPSPLFAVGQENDVAGVR